MAKRLGLGAIPNTFLTLQICEQKNEKKNPKGIEFLVFFPHTAITIKLRKKFILYSDSFEKNRNKYSSTLCRNRSDGSSVLWELSSLFRTRKNRMAPRTGLFVPLDGRTRCAIARYAS